MTEPALTVPSRPARIRVIDIARGVALLAMAIYHFTWDLEFFGYLEPGTTAQGGWKLFARAIASSFLFLVGVSLVLAHARGVRWKPFAIRLAQVAAAAAAISIITYFAVPNGFIFFGILHQIALASLLGVIVLRLPALVLIALSFLAIAAPAFLRSAIFDMPWLWWVGLSSNNPPSNDYVPLFPWFGAVVLGMATAKIARQTDAMEGLRSIQPGRWAHLLEWGGQHSLAFYLLHQPILIACVWLGSQVLPPPAADPRAGFLRACSQQCSEMREAAFCERYCGCMLDNISGMAGGLGALDQSSTNAETQSQIESFAAQCTMQTESDLLSQPSN